MSDELAPVTPLFGASSADAPGDEAPASEPVEASHSVPRLVALPTGDALQDQLEDEAERREELITEAQEGLVRTLARSDKSEQEARALLARWESASVVHAEHDDDLDAVGFEFIGRLRESDIDSIIDRCTELGYLDDSRLAELIVHKSRERKRAGVQGVERALRDRGISRDVIAEVVAGFDRDDEHVRALELARERARRMQGVEKEAAIRRIAGFLARKGYNSGVAFIAAKEALGDGGSSRAASPGSAGVFFGNSPGE